MHIGSKCHYCIHHSYCYSYCRCYQYYLKYSQLCMQYIYCCYYYRIYCMYLGSIDSNSLCYLHILNKGVCMWCMMRCLVMCMLGMAMNTGCMICTGKCLTDCRGGSKLGSLWRLLRRLRSWMSIMCRLW
jgi:hypothetical protein